MRFSVETTKPIIRSTPPALIAGSTNYAVTIDEFTKPGF